MLPLSLPNLSHLPTTPPPHPTPLLLSLTTMSSSLLLLLFHFFFLSTSLISATPMVDQCINKCGTFQIPFPFHLNASSCRPSLSDAFSLSCINSSSLFLTLASQTYRVLHFFPDGVLLDFPNASTCRQYSDLKSFAFSGNQYFGISTDNVLDLYDCEDSSLCKPGCETTTLVMPPGCTGQGARFPSCCYPLSDRSSWRPGDSLARFSQYGCRGFSSWVVFPGSKTGTRGIKLEWGVPRNWTCAANANTVNATSVASAVRCRCSDGFSGDGFPAGVGCLKSCFKNGKEVGGNDCNRNQHARKKAIILAGVITSTIAVVSLLSLCLLRRSNKFTPDDDAKDKGHRQSSMLSQKAGCRSRLFTYHELEEATKGFGDCQKIVDSSRSTLYAGVLLTGGTRVAVAVQRVECESERVLIRVLFRLETLSAVSHRNMAQIMGWSIDSGYSPLVVYEYPENGTFKEYLCQARDHQDENIPLDWYKRLSIAAETATILAFLHHEVSPPIFHHDLQTAFIFLDMDFSVKLAGFELHYEQEDQSCRRNDVYSMGLVLLEVITGKTTLNCSTTGALQKIKKGKVEEIVDPSLYYHEQPAFGREQIEIIADLATRCLLFGGDGKLSMVDVARELLHLTKDHVSTSRRGAGAGPALEETFSNSSLLQMISMSPDSIYTTNLN